MVEIFFIFYFYSFFLSLTKKNKNLATKKEEKENLLDNHPLVTDRCVEPYERCCECSYVMSRGDPNYYCKICKTLWHRECMPTLSELVNHPFHPNHTLKLRFGEVPDYADGKCHFCRAKFRNSFYHCSTCNFSLDVRCGKSPKRVRVDESKSHNHPLTIMMRQVSFVCNACGMLGERNPYVCVACSFMVHEDCINLPHVININRHDHRISHTYSLGPGNRICRVCRLNIDWIYGAYSCSKCPDFCVHSKCATTGGVWDGKELEGVPEEEEDEPMFTMIEENVINHVKHPSHNLTLIADGVVHDQGVRCQLCEGLVYSDKFYSCMECDYILHQTCAHLPKRKRHGLSSSPVSLKEFVKEASEDGFFECLACQRLSAGYMYSNEIYGTNIDLRCAAVDWSCDHDCHPHTLFLTTLDKDTCGACNSKRYVLRCVDCKFNLCYNCASYPKKIKHRCDDHPLVMSFGDPEQQHETSWCTICEGKIDLRKWCYECEECGIICHIHCALGDFTNFNPGLFTTEAEFEEGVVRGVVRNNSSTRPFCSICATRCLAPFIYSLSDQYICSLKCLQRTTGEIARRRKASLIEKAVLKFININLPLE